MLDIAGKMKSVLLALPKRLDERLAYGSAESAREAMKTLDSRKRLNGAIAREASSTAHRHGAA